MTALDRLTQIIPQDQALANKALASSMQGITGINSMLLPTLAKTVGNIQTNFGLPLVNAQTSAVSPAAANAVTSSVGTGTGPRGTVTIMDGLGTAAGWISTRAMSNTVTLINSISTAYLQSGYSNMYNTVTGAYTVHVPVDPPPTPPDPPTYLGYQVVIPGGPGAGTYPAAPVPTAAGAINDAFASGLIPAVQSVISGFSGSNPTQYAALNSNWSNIVNQLNLEKSIQTKATLNFANLVPNSTQSIYGFVLALPSYGQDTTVGGTAQFIQAVANTNNIGGQSIVASMRQGQSRVPGTGVGTNSNIPVAANPPEPQATLSPAQYPYPS